MVPNDIGSFIIYPYTFLSLKGLYLNIAFTYNFIPDNDYLKHINRSFSLPNLTFTPLESLLPTTEEILSKENFNYTDDFELASTVASPTKKILAKSDNFDDIWHEEMPTLDPVANSNIFAFLENQRAVLEDKVGVVTLLKIYKMIARVEQSEDERINYSDLIKVLGKGNEDLIDDIIQLVVADQFFH